MTGGKYLAEERGAFEAKPEADRQSPAIERDAIEPARAPLYEFAAAHDGQPAATWLGYFMARF